MEECLLEVDSEDEEVDEEEDGVINLEDYIAEIKKSEKEWASKHSIKCL